MKSKLGVLMITKNVEDTIEESLESVEDLADEIVIVDNKSEDKTVEIAYRYGAKIFKHNEIDLGKQRAYALSKITADWVLVLDSDEEATPELKKEIKKVIDSDPQDIDGYDITFQGYLFGKPLKHGGEIYKKMVLFRKEKARISSSLIHEKFEIQKGKTNSLKNLIRHNSYRSVIQIFDKFTDYAIRNARQKSLNNETTSIKKIFLYPIHMFYARFIKDKGYKDGVSRIILDIGFAYMEFLTYAAMLWEEN